MVNFSSGSCTKGQTHIQYRVLHSFVLWAPGQTLNSTVRQQSFFYQQHLDYIQLWQPSLGNAQKPLPFYCDSPRSISTPPFTVVDKAVFSNRSSCVLCTDYYCTSRDDQQNYLFNSLNTTKLMSHNFIIKQMAMCCLKQKTAFQQYSLIDNNIQHTLYTLCIYSLQVVGSK